MTSSSPGSTGAHLPAEYVAGHVELGYATTATDGDLLDPAIVLEHLMTNSGLDVAAHDVSQLERSRIHSQRHLPLWPRTERQQGPFMDR